ncbi:otospiralin-like [Thunnus albacares]|uniref:otospiralin-like n=1 Tax=Thunnus maccoyii TaxID=8240 RepID=UPI001C4CAAE5|nr:otospiralin-like [Thunnus maccoyii]XP_042277623.1 otospiralin-like [Thunnus maccoyii]XP_042277624.1 otospiralin-like [Thunnus maccoyii]XP_044230987.1 otospiralin-like [Thunnus albacares]
MMIRQLLSVFILLSVLTLLVPAGAEEGGVDTDEGGRQKRNVPNWALTSSDFFGWVEELRKHAGYQHIDDLARTFWAHFPSADRLGYGTHEPEE